MDLSELENKMQSCVACDLCHSRKQVVFGKGNSKPKLLLLGEAPGETEDEDGIPFNPLRGKCGIQLDKILSWIGITREECYISNSVLCKPPNCRTPTQDEIDMCRWRLMTQIKLLDPALIVAMGHSAVKAILGKEFKGPLNQFFKKDFMSLNIDNKDYKWISTYHMSYLLRRPSEKKKVLPHWQIVKDFVNVIK